MGLRLVSKDERLTFDRGSYGFYYRRITNAQRSRITDKHTNRKGEQDNAAIADDMIEFCTLGWWGVNDLVDGEIIETPFSVEGLKRIPDDIGADMIILFGKNADDEAVEAKNLPTTSANNTITEDSPVDNADKKPKKTKSI